MTKVGSKVYIRQGFHSLEIIKKKIMKKLWQKSDDPIWPSENWSGKGQQIA